MEESDLLLLTKSDALSDSQQEHLLQQLQQQYPSSRVLSVSAQSGAGIAEWLNALQQHQRVGERLLSIDYDKYAHGEAVLGWLNATLRITAPEPTDWNALLHQLMDGLSAELKQQQIPVGHVKAIIENANAFAVCNLTHTDFPSTFRGDAGTSTEATLTINARAETTPTHLEQLVRAQLQQLLPSSFRQEELAWKSLQPGRPNPTHRFTVVL
jgi:G3E family GTPase